jgi:diadenosine tetraphosphate (Ap4A) HIT family hydrolase
LISSYRNHDVSTPEKSVTATLSSCPLCDGDGGPLLWRNDYLRVIEVNDADYPGFTRVIWHDHQTEMTALSVHERNILMQAVYTVEQVQRDVLSPDKINLASLGNMVPHVHWHIIPRWRDDRHFPDAIWAPAHAAAGAESDTWRARQTTMPEQLKQYHQQLIAALQAMPKA